MLGAEGLVGRPRLIYLVSFRPQVERRSADHSRMVWLSAVVLAVLLAVLPPGGTFVDDDGNVHEGGIEAIAAEGITKGCNPPLNDRYCPSRSVTRGEMAVFLSRALGLAATGSELLLRRQRPYFRGWDQPVAGGGDHPGLQPSG